MEPEKAMATRKLTQHNGAMGEAEALRDFLQMGASVNSLTSSDYGLDLHLQLPLVPQKFGRLESEWALSGRTAHVQVKNMTKGGSPSVEDSSVEGWVSGSKVGSPTFVFVIKNNKEKTFYSPRDLARLLAIWKGRNAEKRAKGEKEIESVTLTVDAGRTFDVDLLPTLLHLWTKYPRVLMNPAVNIDEWSRLDAARLKGQEEGFVAQVFLAWLRSHFPGHPILEEGREEPLALPLVASAWAELEKASRERPDSLSSTFHEWTPEFLEYASDVMRPLLEAARHFNAWPTAPLATSYSLETTPRESFEEAKALVREVARFYSLCLERAPESEHA